MTANEDASALTVKELVLELRADLQTYSKEHRALHDEMKDALSAHMQEATVDARRLAELEAKTAILVDKVETLEDSKLKQETTISTLKWVAGGGSLVGMASGILGFIALVLAFSGGNPTP